MNEQTVVVLLSLSFFLSFSLIPTSIEFIRIQCVALSLKYTTNTFLILCKISPSHISYFLSPSPLHTHTCPYLSTPVHTCSRVKQHNSHLSKSQTLKAHTQPEVHTVVGGCAATINFKFQEHLRWIFHPGCNILDNHIHPDNYRLCD